MGGSPPPLGPRHPHLHRLRLKGALQPGHGCAGHGAGRVGATRTGYWL